MFRRPPRSTRTATLFPYTTLFRSPEFTKLPAQITGGAAQIAMQAVAIDPELLCRAGHQLAEPESTLGAQGHRIVPALLDQHRVHEADRKTGLARNALPKRVQNAQIGRATCRASVCPSVKISVGAGSITHNTYLSEDVGVDG